MHNKDYYKILNVPEAASASEIKTAYRKLAKQYHPDANPDNLKAEQRFKDISEAYNILKSARTRKEYDQMRRYGTATGGGRFSSFDPFENIATGTGTGFEGFGFPGQNGNNNSIGDLIKQIFGLENNQRGPSAGNRYNGSDEQVIEVFISFDDAIFGCEKVLKLSTPLACQTCHGSGFFQGMQCAACQGGGHQRIAKRVKIRVEPGTDDGHKLRLRGVAGADGIHDGSSDLIIRLRVEPHKFFRRKGNDILCDISLSSRHLASGTKVRIRTITGQKVELNIPPGTTKGAIFKLPQLGISRNGEKGDQLVFII